MKKVQSIYLVFIITIIIIVLILLSDGIKNNKRNERKIITDKKIKEIILNNLDTLLNKFAIYESQLNKLKQEITWLKENVTPYAEKYGESINKFLNVSSYIPLPFADAISGNLKRGITSLVDISELLKKEIERIDEFNVFYSELKNTKSKCLDFQNPKDLDSLNYLLKNKFTLLLENLNNDLNVVDTMLVFSLDVIEVIKDLNKTKNDWWLKVKTFFPGAKNNTSSDGVIDILLEKIKMKINQFHSNVKLFNKSFKEDLLLISRINACSFILKLCN